MKTMKTKVLAILDSLKKETDKIKLFELVHQLKVLNKGQTGIFRKAYIELTTANPEAGVKMSKVLFLNGDLNKGSPNKEFLEWEKNKYGETKWQH